MDLADELAYCIKRGEMRSMLPRFLSSLRLRTHNWIFSCVCACGNCNGYAHPVLLLLLLFVRCPLTLPLSGFRVVSVQKF